MPRTVADAELQVYDPGNYALSFGGQGSGDYVEVPDDASLDITGDITIAFTASIPEDPDVTTNNDFRQLVDKGAFAPGGAYNCLLEETGRLHFSVVKTDREGIVTPVPTDGTVFTAVCTHDTSTGESIIYIDGSQANSETDATGNINTNTTPLRLSSPTDARQLLGTLDRVYVDARVWSASEAADYDNGDAVSDSARRLALELDDGEGTTATDSSGNGNDGTLNGDPQWVEGIAPDDVVPGGDIASARVAERLQDSVDQGRIALHDDDASYVGTITSGDRVRFRTRLDGETSLSHRWTGMVRTPTPTETGPATQRLDLRVDDFVFGVLDVRQVVNVFENEAISGSSSAILETILRNDASEIATDLVESVNTTADVSWNAKKLLDCVRELAEKGDALVGQRDTSLIFKRLTAPAVEFTLQDSDRGLAAAPTNDDHLVNELRVEGGEDTNVDDSQTTQSATVTVTDTNRLTTQLDVSKATVALVEVYTQTTGSGDNVVVRIHPDDGGGSPVAPGDREQDIARRTLASNFLAADGFTTFLMPDHTLPPKTDPHLLIESDGSTGQDIGTDGAGTPTYRAHYPFTLATVVSDKSSVDTYRRREGSVRAPEADTKALTEQRGNATLRHHSQPADELHFPADSNRAHNLRTGDVVAVDEPDLDVSGDCIVVRRTDEYDGRRDELTTDLVLQDVTTV